MGRGVGLEERLPVVEAISLSLGTRCNFLELQNRPVGHPAFLIARRPVPKGCKTIITRPFIKRKGRRKKEQKGYIHTRKQHLKADPDVVLSKVKKTKVDFGLYRGGAYKSLIPAYYFKELTSCTLSVDSSLKLGPPANGGTGSAGSA
ncbi:hypothetical protein AVEN_203348-1 [Araneus ventricosus]|uniref:Uncharacterized protein n=1 Tax=Araneus ventricosus TaxID=182803 RepID=A0A4Y2SND4_ARAVE|nr:hypothetical protein AVEN_203348-1 [Araneus ventricosus]